MLLQLVIQLAQAQGIKTINLIRDRCPLSANDLIITRSHANVQLQVLLLLLLPLHR